MPQIHSPIIDFRLFFLYILFSIVSKAELSVVFENGGNPFPTTTLSISVDSDSANFSADGPANPTVSGNLNPGSGSFDIVIEARGEKVEGSNPFDPSTFSGGDDAESNARVSVGNNEWGVASEANLGANIRNGEAIVITFDLSGLNLESDESLIWTQASGRDEAGSLFIYRDEGGSGSLIYGGGATGNPAIFSLDQTIQDGDRYAIVEGASGHKRLQSMSFEIVTSKAPLPVQDLIAGTLSSGAVLNWSDQGQNGNDATASIGTVT
ncbi:MAG: hypothetical protein AAF212_13135, partial [Verrucomicrobiota bacterium]